MKSNDKLSGALKAISPETPIRSDLIQALAGRLDIVEPLRQEMEARRRAFHMGTVFGLILGVLATFWIFFRLVLGGFYIWDL